MVIIVVIKNNALNANYFMLLDPKVEVCKGFS